VWAHDLPPDYQAFLGQIVAKWAHLEEMMILLMGTLLGDEPINTPARQIFRSVNSTQARVAILRSLLEESAINKHKGPEYDQVIDEFASLTTERNNYVHGLWFTNQDTGDVLRADPSITHEMGPFTTAKPVSIKQPQHVLLRMEALVNAIVRIWGAVTAQQASPPPPSEQAG
jgi:hypothetical protein